MLAVLDSTVLIDFLRGRPAVQRVWHLQSTGDVPATTAINIEVDAARLAGTWRRERAQQGITLWQADCLIAAATSPRGTALHWQSQGLSHAHRRPLAGRCMR